MPHSSPPTSAKSESHHDRVTALGSAGECLQNGETVLRADTDAHFREPFSPITEKEVIPKVYSNDDLGLKVSGLTDAPLWSYVMRESMLEANGLQLGGVGSVIVGEAMSGLLNADSSSFVSHNKKNPQQPWKPTPGSSLGEFTMAEMLQLAGVLKSR